MKQETSQEVQGHIPAEKTAKYHLSENPEIHEHIMEILRDLYNDPVWAVLREYFSNALDAHRDPETGFPEDQPKAIEVTTPTNFNNYNLKIRDYGAGLSVEGFEKYALGYGEIGDSKWKYEQQIGGFGIGMKSFMALSGSAVFNCYYNGKVAKWLCQPDSTEDGRPRLLSHTDTDEPSGIEVSIPIDPKTYTNIKHKFKKLVQYVDYPINLDGQEYNPFKQTFANNEPLLTMEVPSFQNKYIYLFKDFNDSITAANTYDTSITFLINSIPYPLSTEHFKKVVEDNIDSETNPGEFGGLKRLLKYNKIVIEIPDNFMKLLPNREGFIHNKKTNEACISLWDSLKKQLKEASENELKKIEDPRIALKTAVDFAYQGIYYFKDQSSSDDIFDFIHQTNLVYVPYKYGRADINTEFTVDKKDIGELTSNIYVGSFQEYKYKTNFGFKNQTVYTSLDKLINKNSYADIHKIYGVDTNESIVSILRSKRSSSIILKSNTPSLHDNTFNSFMFRFKVNLVWIPEEQGNTSYIAKYLKAKNYFEKVTDNYSNQELDTVSTLPILFINGTEKQKNEVLKIFGHVVQYAGNLFEDKDYIAYKTSLKTKHSTTKLNKHKSNKHKSNAHWYRFVPGKVHSKNSDQWELCDAPEDDKFLYVYINRFLVDSQKVITNFSSYESQLNQILSNNGDNSKLESIIKFVEEISNNNKNIVIYGIKSSNKNKPKVIPNNAINFVDYLQDLICNRWLHPVNSSLEDFTITHHQLSLLKECIPFQYVETRYEGYENKGVAIIRLLYLIHSAYEINAVDIFDNFKKSHIFNQLFNSYGLKIRDINSKYLEKAWKDDLNHMLPKAPYGLASLILKRLQETSKLYEHNWKNPMFNKANKIIEQYPIIPVILNSCLSRHLDESQIDKIGEHIVNYVKGQDCLKGNK